MSLSAAAPVIDRGGRLVFASLRTGFPGWLRCPRRRVVPKDSSIRSAQIPVIAHQPGETGLPCKRIDAPCSSIHPVFVLAEGSDALRNQS
jgi:hypothetical protein